MSISTSIKSLLAINGYKQSDLMDILKVNSKQALSNKFVGGRWSAADLVSIADFTGAKLAFILPNDERIVISADQAPVAPQGERGEAGIGGVTSPNTEN